MKKHSNIIKFKRKISINECINNVLNIFCISMNLVCITFSLLILGWVFAVC